MRILIPSIQVPFITGGAYFHIHNLKNALIEHGHQVEVVTFPFEFSPESYISRLMDFCAHIDFTSFNGVQIDKVIALQFPAYYVKHPDKTIWLMHQHRAVYELFDQQSASGPLKELKTKIQSYDLEHLVQPDRIYANSQNVANRLKKYNNIESRPVYHPPSNETKFYREESYDFIFFPSRLEELKRQPLLIQAMQYVKSPVKAIIAGEGGQKANYLALINALKVADKVSLIGHIAEKEKYTLYARCLGVFFGPYDEDYGYITLEAMLAAKPVITCTDSGGPLEFVIDRETGFIVEPDPEQIAEKIDFLYTNRQKTRQMGEQSREHYLNKNISWDNVVHSLLEK